MREKIGRGRIRLGVYALSSRHRSEIGNGKPKKANKSACLLFRFSKVSLLEGVLDKL